jgi:hypothetical protein
MTSSGPAISHEQRRAAAVIGGLLVVSLLAWLALDLVTTDPQPREPDGLGASAPSSPPPRPDGAQDGQGGDDGDSTGESEADEDGADVGNDETPELVALEFDGVCTVEVDPAEQTASPRPWHFGECERAPIELRGTEIRWIVVLDSLAGSDHSEQDALARVTGDQQLLWSDHYPSLNPNLWVVVDGPFEDRAAAVDAAAAHGGGACPRELSDDAGDRYCVAADGCVGETSD